MDVGDLPEGPTSPDLEVPTWIPYSCVPLGSYLMCFRFLQVAWAFWKTGEVPHADHGVKGVDEAELDVLVATGPTSAAAQGSDKR
jgi:C4-dicarboxylate transporter DctQ subunit